MCLDGKSFFWVFGEFEIVGVGKELFCFVY